MLRIADPGLLTTLQDTGRPGNAHLGVGRAGAADMPALQLANALAGNSPHDCALEMTLAGPTLSFDDDTWIALTGAPLPAARIGEDPVPAWRPVCVPGGARITLGAMPRGCRSYLAVAGGGIDVPTWRASRSTDVNARLGPVPRPLAAGDALPTRACDWPPGVAIGNWSLDPRPWFDASRSQRVRVLPGIHAKLLDAPSREALAGGEFRVGRDSNRVGMRLDGTRLTLTETPRMASAGVVTGTVQLPPDGRPIIMGCEHPVTGGYPRIAQVAAVNLPWLAQCRPGDTVRFAWITQTEALRLLRTRDAALGRLVARIQQRLGTA